MFVRKPVRSARVKNPDVNPVRNLRAEVAGDDPGAWHAEHLSDEARNQLAKSSPAVWAERCGGYVGGFWKRLQWSLERQFSPKNWAALERQSCTYFYQRRYAPRKGWSELRLSFLWTLRFSKWWIIILLGIPTCASDQQNRGPVITLRYRHLFKPRDVAQEWSPAYGDGSARQVRSAPCG